MHRILYHGRVMNDPQSTQGNLADAAQAFWTAALFPITRRLDAMALDLTKLTLDVATLHKLAVDQHDLLATLRTQLDTALKAVQGPSIQIDTVTQDALDALDLTVKEAAALLTTALGTVTPPSAPITLPEPIPAITPAPAPSGAPTGVEVAAKPD